MHLKSKPKFPIAISDSPTNLRTTKADFQIYYNAMQRRELTQIVDFGIAPKARGYRPMPKLTTGFTFIELLVVVAIVGILASVVLAAMSDAREKAYKSRTALELNQLFTALALYASNNNGDYPADVPRGLPNGIEQYLAGSHWPDAPWPSSVYDWDNWSETQLAGNPKSQVYQISVRFCDINGNNCRFPNEPWVNSDWDENSAVYYCISGPCRSHSSKEMNHPGYCMGGVCP